jgi:hypothetical protein
MMIAHSGSNMQWQNCTNQYWRDGDYNRSILGSVTEDNNWRITARSVISCMLQFAGPVQDMGNRTCPRRRSVRICTAEDQQECVEDVTKYTVTLETR